MWALRAFDRENDNFQVDMEFCCTMGFAHSTKSSMRTGQAPKKIQTFYTDKHRSWHKLSKTEFYSTESEEKKIFFQVLKGRAEKKIVHLNKGCNKVFIIKIVTVKMLNIHINKSLVTNSTLLKYDINFI